MKRYICFIVAIMATHSAFAECYNISNRDMKYRCMAEEKQDTGYCYNINDRDEKYFCLAIVKHDKSSCYNIADKNQQNLCKSKF